jgi:hypothetical protein
MRSIPKISGPDGHDFHDSSLIDFSINSHLDVIEIVVSTPDVNLVEGLWLIRCEGVLRLEYETLGDGSDSYNSKSPPLEIYEIYNDQTSDERSRWVDRLKILGVAKSEANKVYHLVLASSFARGWGERENMEGISIICRRVSVMPAPKEYDGLEYSRPRIEAAQNE